MVISYSCNLSFQCDERNLFNIDYESENKTVVH